MLGFMLIDAHMPLLPPPRRYLWSCRTAQRWNIFQSVGSSEIVSPVQAAGINFTGVPQQMPLIRLPYAAGGKKVIGVKRTDPHLTQPGSIHKPTRMPPALCTDLGHLLICIFFPLSRWIGGLGWTWLPFPAKSFTRSGKLLFFYGTSISSSIQSFQTVLII